MDIKCVFFANIRTVHFSERVVVIPTINEQEWHDDYKQARIGPWISIAADRARFNRRIQQTAEMLYPIFQKRK